jgi:hypothetical protein
MLGRAGAGRSGDARSVSALPARSRADRTQSTPVVRHDYRHRLLKSRLKLPLLTPAAVGRLTLAVLGCRGTAADKTPPTRAQPPDPAGTMPDPWPSSSAATGEDHASEHPPTAEAAAPAQIRPEKGKEPRRHLIESRTGFRRPARVAARLEDAAAGRRRRWLRGPPESPTRGDSGGGVFAFALW